MASDNDAMQVARFRRRVEEAEQHGKFYVEFIRIEEARAVLDATAAPLDLEPTEAEVQAFKAAWEAEDDRLTATGASWAAAAKAGTRTRAGLRAMLAVRLGR